MNNKNLQKQENFPNNLYGCEQSDNLDDQSFIYKTPSLKGKMWAWQSKNLAYQAQITQELSSGDLKHPKLIADIISARLNKISAFDPEQKFKLHNYINPKIKNLMPEPHVLQDMEKAVKRIYQAILQKEKIVICGDYDVDGATSSAVLSSALRTFGCDIEIFIPDRIKDGYGPNSKRILSIFKKR